MNYLFKIICFFLSLLLFNSTYAYKKITLDDIYLNRKFSPNDALYDLVSMNDGEHYGLLVNYSIIKKVDFETGNEEDIIFNVSEHNGYKDKFIIDCSFNADDSKILLGTDFELIYRHSYKANYLIYDVARNTIVPLSENGKQQLATFSPDGNKVAFVRDNNIYIKDLKTLNEKQISYDGKFGEIINGAPDWVYEEEFGFSQGYFWSPSGDRIAFYKVYETRVKQYNMIIYEDIYPTLFQYRYPKAGEKNSIITIQVYDLEEETTQLIDIGRENDIYIPRIEWTKNNDVLCITRLNRAQNRVDILLGDVITGDSKVIYSEVSETYISEIEDDQVVFLEGGSEFILKSEKDGFQHLYLYSIKSDQIRQLTSGKWEVEEFIDYNPETKTVYYKSLEDSPIESQIYSVTIDGTNKKKISTLHGNNAIYFNSNFKYYFLSHNDANTPHNLSLHRADGELLRVIEDNQKLIETIEEHGFTKKEFITVPGENDLKFNAYMIKPPDFDSNKKYPLFMFVYGAPGKRKVVDEWDFRTAWFQMLAQNGYIVVCIDGRGTGGRGVEFEKCIFRQMGKLETIDQINAAKYFGTLSYIDSSRIGIFGWSQGGVLTALCMTKGADVFKMGISVALVSDWKFYDTIYTERFLGKPEDNPNGYYENSPINFVHLLKGHLLIIHGSADDNVHIQNTYEFAKALIKAKKQFDLQIYPDKNHHIPGGYTQYHLYTKMTDYIYTNL